MALSWFLIISCIACGFLAICIACLIISGLLIILLISGCWSIKFLNCGLEFINSCITPGSLITELTKGLSNILDIISGLFINCCCACSIDAPDIPVPKKSAIGLLEFSVDAGVGFVELEGAVAVAVE